LYAIHTKFAQNPHPTLTGENSQLRARSKHIKFFIPAITMRAVRKGWRTVPSKLTLDIYSILKNIFPFSRKKLTPFT
jgi:hypothetical protein